MPDSIVLKNEREQMQVTMRQFAAALGRLTDEQVPAALDVVRQLVDLSDEFKNTVRTRAIQLLQAAGTKVTDKGSLQVLIGGYKLTAIPTRTGLDPKKLETVLRRRGLDPTAGMNPTVTYKVDQQKVDKLVAEGKLTQGDLEAATYEESYRVMSEPMNE